MSQGGLTTKLHRARAKLLGTTATDIPVPFRILCECGQPISGIRRPSFQQITCSSCGAIRFVLPVNVYPSTRSVHSEAVSGPFGKRLMAAARELIPSRHELPPENRSDPRRRSGKRQQPGARPDSADVQQYTDEVDNPDLPPDSTRRRLDQTRQKLQQLQSSATDSSTPVVEPEVRIPPLKLQKLHIRRTARRTFTPFRMLMLGVLLSAFATGWWIHTRNRIDNARQTWRNSIDEADTALEAGRLEDLQVALQSAVGAAAVLQRTDSEVQRAANLLLETQAVNRLNEVDLYLELLASYEKGGRLNRQLADAAETALKTGWYVFECPINPDGQQPAMVKLRLPLPVGRRGARIEVRSSLMSRAAAEFSGLSILFVAQVESCQPPETDADEWVIRLDAESCTLLTSVLHAERAGFEVEESRSLRQQLEKQRLFIEGIDTFALRSEDQLRQLELQQESRQ